jgi:hypothetical protein
VNCEAKQLQLVSSEYCSGIQLRLECCGGEAMSELRRLLL